MFRLKLNKQWIDSLLRSRMSELQYIALIVTDSGDVITGDMPVREAISKSYIGMEKLYQDEHDRITQNLESDPFELLELMLDFNEYCELVAKYTEFIPKGT